MKVLLAILLIAWSVVVSGQDIPVSFPSGNLTLEGTLSLPQGSGPFPVVVFVHGSGPGDRDQTSPITPGNLSCIYPQLVNDTIRNFKDIGEGLVQNGYATLRYDKRTLTHASALNPRTITVYDFVDDLNAAVEYVKSRSEIDSSCIVLLGHSQGCNFTPLIARNRNDIYAILSLGAAARGIDSIIAIQTKDLFYKCLKDTARGDAEAAKALSDYGKVRDGSWDPNTPIGGAFPQFMRSWIHVTDSAIWSYNQISEPALFLHGMTDFNIPLEDAQRYDSQLTNPAHQVYYMDSLNHFFTPDNSPVVATQVVDTIVDWLKSLKTTGIEQMEFNPNFVRVFRTNGGIQIDVESSVSYKVNILDLQGRILISERELTGHQFINSNERSNSPLIVDISSEGWVFRKLIPAR